MELIKLKDPETLAKACKENFTISEIIFNMIHSDTFRVKFEDLEIRVVSDRALLFRDDTYTPYDILNFSGSMYEKFEKLLSECWITVKEVKIDVDPEQKFNSNFSFLYDYCPRNIRSDDLQLKNTNKINEFKFNSEVHKPSVIKKFLTKVNNSSRINIRVMAFSDGKSTSTYFLNYFDEYKAFFKKFDGFNFELNWAFSILTDNDGDVLKLKSIYDALMRYKDKNPSVSFDNFELILNVQLGSRFPCRLDYQIDKLCSVFDIKLIKHFVLSRRAIIHNVDFSSVKKLKYLEIFVIDAKLDINYRTLGDWKDMKYLKTVNFLSSDIDYRWLSDYLPPTIEKISIIQLNESTSN